MFCLEQPRPVRHVRFLNVWSLVWINSINNPQSTVQSVLKVILAQPQLQVLLYVIASSWENVNMRDSWLPQLAVTHWIMQQMLRSYGARNVGQDTGGLWDIPSSGGFKIVGKQKLPKYTVPSRISTVKSGEGRFGGKHKGSSQFLLSVEWGRLCERDSVWIGTWKVDWDGGHARGRNWHAFNIQKSESTWSVQAYWTKGIRWRLRA